MNAIQMTNEVRLAYGAAVLFIVALVIALIGERALPLFGGDRELAARVYKTLYVVLLGGMASLSVPLFVVGIVQKARFMLAAAGSDNSIASLLLRDEVPRIASFIGFTLMSAFAVFWVLVAIIIWMKGD